MYQQSCISSAHPARFHQRSGERGIALILGFPLPILMAVLMSEVRRMKV